MPCDGKGSDSGEVQTMDQLRTGGGGEGGRDEGLEKGKGNSYGSVSNVQFIYNFTTVSFYVPALLLIYRLFTLSYKLNCFFELPGKI